MMRWLLTYADMITLLLALFIILFSISTISKVKLQRLVHDISGGFNNVDANNTPPNGGQASDSGNTIEAMQASLQDYVKKNKLESKVQTQITKDGLVITLLTDRALYDSGSADLKPQTKQILDVVDAQLKTRPNNVRVEGHTDNIPIHNDQFDSNWELSAARAVNVTRYFVEHDNLAPSRLSLAGYGQFRPKFPNDTDVHRAANRRIEILVLRGDKPVAKANPDEEQ